MSETKWVNPHQPQTLYMGVILCYVMAVSGLLFGVVAKSVVIGLLIIIALAVGGFGIANEKKWGYAIAVIGAIAQLASLLLLFGLGTFTHFTTLIDFAFDAVLVGLLLHPMSRDYQRVWFK